jgi:hypothetical protein
VAAKNRKRKRRGGDFQPPPKRGKAVAASGQAQTDSPRAARRPARGGRERPPAPWWRFPLVELVVLLAMVMLIWGFVVSNVTMIAAGMTLGMLAGLELSIREHFSGYKSHSTVLAGFAALVVLGLGYFFLPSGWIRGVNLAISVTVFGAGFYLLREAFKRRSGGLGFR